MAQQPLSKNGVKPKSIEKNQNINDINDDSLKSYDWQIRMADLVGFEEVGLTNNLNNNYTNPETNPEQSALAITNDEASELQSQPQLSRTKQPLSANPFAKASLVGATTLITVLVGGVFLSNMMNGTSPQQQTTYVPEKPQIPISEPTQPKPETEIEILKTKLALAEQANAVKAAQLQLRTVQPQLNQKPTPTVQTETKPKEITRVVVQRIPTPAPTVYIPRTITVERIVPRTVTVERIVQVPQPAIKQPTKQPTPVVAARPTLPQLAPAKVEPPLAANLLPTIPQSVTPIQNTQNIPVANPINQSSGKSVAAGTSTKAVLSTALFGEINRTGSNNDNTNDNTFIVTLKQPLKTPDDQIALPTGTELLTQINRISESGMVDLKVVSVMVQKDGKPTEITLPSGAIKIRALKGTPLIANKYHDRGGAVAGMDAGLFALGGIGKAAEILNRPQTQYITTASGNIVTDSNPRGNVFTGVLEGGMGSLVPQITVRNQQAISEMMGRGNIWFLRAGTDVEVYVNQIVQLQI
ncbi:hypothetical protein NIES2101_20145 [Calothrix sp. HK-06]|nr:hypothetical protein NIES2101_20145 [Calothrix sp. HK-06]